MIHGLQDGAVAMLTKMHHAAVDGVSGAEVMRVLFDDAATGRELGPAPDLPAQRFPSEVEMLGRGVTVWCATRFGRCARCRPRCLTSTAYRRSATSPA